MTVYILTLRHTILGVYHTKDAALASVNRIDNNEYTAAPKPLNTWTLYSNVHKMVGSIQGFKVKT